MTHCKRLNPVSEADYLGRETSLEWILNMQLTHRVVHLALVAILAVTASAVPTLSAKDWPQWRGAERLGLWTETGGRLNDSLRMHGAGGLCIRGPSSEPGIGD